MVYHVPYPLNPQATTASGIRPVAMKRAFEELGHEVWLVSGHSVERKQAIKRVDEAVRAGTRFDFVYSESSTMATAMTDPHHLPLHPLLDFSFLRRMRKQGAKVGLFYRDIYWRFEGFGEGLSWIKRSAAKAAYQWDLMQYRTAVDVLYLPSDLMAPHVGLPITMTALPPGHGIETPSQGPASGAHLLYVGGLGAHYKMDRLLEAVHRAAESGAEVSLTLVTPKNLWAGAGEEYTSRAHGPVRVVHASGSELVELYSQTNIASLVMEPNDYRTFANPVKLYEYIGQAKPIMASIGTLPGEFVAANGAGWTVPYEVDAITALLTELAGNPDLVNSKRDGVLAIRDAHAWADRARRVVEQLT